MKSINKYLLSGDKHVRFGSKVDKIYFSISFIILSLLDSTLSCLVATTHAVLLAQIWNGSSFMLDLLRMRLMTNY